jgi:VWFA-related protein
VKIALSILIISLAASVSAQQAPTISSKVSVVSVLATVHDQDGRVVTNLTPDDFVLLEDGRPQKIDYFSKEVDLALTVGLLVDTSRSQTKVLDQERYASYTFLDHVLREGKDQAFVAHFDTRVETLQGLTSSRSELASALAKLLIPEHVGTLIYSAVKDSSENPMRQRAGRKAFILLTDGVAYKDPTSIGAAIEYAQRADAIIYSIRFSDPISPYRPFRAAVLGAMSERGKQGLQRMAKETGGISYEVKKNQPIEAIYSRIENVLRNQYTIGYTPDRPQPDGKYHKIKLTTKDGRLTVTARDGYYAE